MIEIEPVTQDPHEITLADQHVPATIPVDFVEQNLSLPAALCDDKLLEEINSIPEKMGFKIGEVADMLGIKQYVLRYWESEFDILKPKKASNNQRYYTKKDVENAYLIRKLLHRDRFSIEGARGALKDLKSFVRSEVRKDKALTSMSQKLEHLQDEAEELLMQIRRARQAFM
jgi:DNA-binding transcriptional MerR regulator